MNKSAKIGALVLGTGAFMLLSTLGLVSGDYFLLVLGAGFVGVYALLGGRRDYGNVGFLIPGTVLAAIGGYALLARWSGNHGSLFFGGLSAAFLAVFLVHTISFRQLSTSQRIWPLYPAGGLALFSALLYGSEVLGWQWSTKGLEVWNYAWVIALMGVGLWLMLRKPAAGKE